MAKARVVYRCNECAAAHPKWGGRCLACNAWNTLIEDLDGPDPAVALSPARPPPRPPAALPTLLGEVDALVGRPAPTGIAELDRVLGGGLVPGSVTLLG